MSRMLCAFALGSLASFGVGACAETAPSDREGNRVAIGVSPLTLPGIQDACYGLTVFDAAGGGGQVVWSEDDVCSDQYGDGVGAITYIGTCVDENAAGPQMNSVQLVLEQLCDGPCADDLSTAIDASTYVNPCAAPGDCVLDVPCEENADALVEFNITVMRDAGQGFFDIAVNFEDIFCSAKFDCEYGPDDPIELLHTADGDRGHTAVLALACSAATETGVDTQLFMNDITIKCDNGYSTVLSPNAGPGKVYDPPGDPADGRVWQYATYKGIEAITCGDVDGDGDEDSCNKVFWNVAIGIEGLPAGCFLQTTASARDGTPAGGFLRPSESYPVIHFGPIQLTDDVGVACTDNALDAEGSAVTTEYHRFNRISHFRNGMVLASDQQLWTGYVGKTAEYRSIGFCDEASWGGTYRLAESCDTECLGGVITIDCQNRTAEYPRGACGCSRRDARSYARDYCANQGVIASEDDFTIEDGLPLADWNEVGSDKYDIGFGVTGVIANASVDVICSDPNRTTSWRPVNLLTGAYAGDLVGNCDGISRNIKLPLAAIVPLGFELQHQRGAATEVSFQVTPLGCQ